MIILMDKNGKIYQKNFLDKNISEKVFDFIDEILSNNDKNNIENNIEDDILSIFQKRIRNFQVS